MVSFRWGCAFPADLTWRRQYRRVVAHEQTPSRGVVEGQAPPGGPVHKLIVVATTGRWQTWPAGAGKPRDTDSENLRRTPSESGRKVFCDAEVIHGRQRELSARLAPRP